jgi:hypothetical protein
MILSYLVCFVRDGSLAIPGNVRPVPDFWLFFAKWVVWKATGSEVVKLFYFFVFANMVATNNSRQL